MLALPSTPCGGISPMLIDFVVAEGIASAEATKGHENRRMSAVALWKPSAPLLLGLFAVDFIRFLDKHAGVA